MKRMVVLALLFCIAIVALSAAVHQSLPLGHRAYDILDIAEIRGIIDPLPSARPYAGSTVVSSLKRIQKSPMISSLEREEIQGLLSELEVEYKQTENLSSLVAAGSYSSYWSEAGIGVRAGIKADFSYTQGLSIPGAFDSRNLVIPYFESDIGDVLSVYMDFGLSLDHIDPRFVLPNDFVIPTEARYDTITDAVGSFFYGSSYSPEIALQMLDGNVQLRYAGIQHDWGVGLNNFMLSGSARSFPAVETSITFAPWLNFQFIAGSLGKFWDKELNKLSYFNHAVSSVDTGYLDEYVFSESMLNTAYDNNFTAQRVEVSLPGNISVGIYESVLYRKRFELAYLNPVSILMFEQITMGDFDNMLAGIDLQWYLPGVMRLYGAFSTTEMDKINPSELFVEPRNIMGFQGGADFDVPLFSFAKLTVQYTYLSPFFYTHYPVYIDYNDDGDIDEIYQTLYVNEGVNLGYPLRPNSDELLLAGDVSLGDSWSVHGSVKYQRRSGQYGFNMDEYMIYKAANQEAYDEKDFSAHLFQKNLGIELTVSKRVKSLPVTFSVSYLYHGQTQRDLTPTTWWVYPVYDDIVTSPSSMDPLDIGDDAYVSETNEAGTPLTNGESGVWESYAIQYAPTGLWSDWEDSHAVRVGFSIWK